MKSRNFLALAALTSLSAPALAQDQGDPGITADAPPKTVFDGDYVSIGAGVAYGPSYSGSDEYAVFPLPIVQGSLGGVGINPRPAGIALDFIPDPDDGVAFAFGPVVRMSRDRADLEEIEDPIVAAYGELDMAVEVGASAGIKIPKVLHPYDSLSFNTDAVWDVAGAHGGMQAMPSVTYFTPFSRALAASLSLSTTWMDDDYADYYYSVPSINTLLPDEDVLPGFQAEGGFKSAGVTMLLAYDLGGDFTNGGLSLVGIGGYSRLMGDAADTPFTSIRGDADQWLFAAGIGYTF